MFVLDTYYGEAAVLGYAQGFHHRCLVSCLDDRLVGQWYIGPSNIMSILISFLIFTH